MAWARWGFERYDAKRFSLWLKLGRLEFEFDGGWAWAFQIYLSRMAWQFQFLGWILQISWY